MGDKSWDILTGLLGAGIIIAAIVEYSKDGGSGATAFGFIGLGVLLLGRLAHTIENLDISAKGVKLKTRERLPPVEYGVNPTTPQDVDEPDEQTSAAQYLIASIALRATVEGLISEQTDAKVYALDAESGLLLPIKIHEADFVRTYHGWGVGQGATGTAFDQGTMVYVTGEAVWDSTYGVPEDMEDDLRGITAVASMPVTDSAGTTVAVLTVTTTSPTRSPLDDIDTSFALLREPADLIGTALEYLTGLD